MIRSAILSSAVALFLLPGPAYAWRAMNYHEVYPVSDGVFEVIGRPGSGPAQYWCAAGDFARHRIGTAAGQRIYVWRPYGPSTVKEGRRAVQFSLVPPPGGEADSGYSLTVRTPGVSLTSAAARQFCYDNDRFDWFRRP